MTILRKLSGEHLLDLSGVGVMGLVGFLAILTAPTGISQLVIAILVAIQIIAFLVFISDIDSKHKLLLFWLEAAVISGLYFLVDQDFIAIFSIVWIVQAVELYGPQRSVRLLFASVAMYAVARLYHWQGDGLADTLFSALLFILLQVFAFSSSQRAIRERELREETAALNRELLATRELLAQTTAHSERVRIARDLHDILGHHMTALILNLEVANHAVAGADQEKAQEKIEQSLALAKLLLSDIRAAVSELRDSDAINLKQSIEKLLLDIPRLEVKLQLEEAPVIDDVELAETLLRCIQEAITNVLRHSQASSVQVGISEAENQCVLSVSDNGGASSPIQLGNGLKGMTERVNSQGGNLSWSQNDGGFALLAKLPLAKAL